MAENFAPSKPNIPGSPLLIYGLVLAAGIEPFAVTAQNPGGQRGAPNMKISRREFLGLAGLGAVGTAALGSAAIGLHDTTEDLAFGFRQIALAGLPKSFHGYRIGVLSDIHLGVAVRDEFVAEAVAMLQRAKVDLLLLAGDYLWIPDSALSRATLNVRNPKFHGLASAQLITAIYRRLGQILDSFSPPDGSFAVFGNHDQWMGPDICLRELTNSKRRFINNQEIQITRPGGKLKIYGADDYWTGVPHKPEWSSGKTDAECRILLCHNPDYTSYLLGRRDIHFDLALSGHTHGGQCLLPVIGALGYNIRDTRFSSGLYDSGTWKALTTRGIGVVEVSYRLNCPPEVTVVELVAA